MNNKSPFGRIDLNTSKGFYLKEKFSINQYNVRS